MGVVRFVENVGNEKRPEYSALFSWLRVVDDVRTVLSQSDECVYIPELSYNV